MSVAEAQSTVAIVHVNGTLYCTTNASPGPNGTATSVFPNATLQVACSGDVVANAPSNATSNANGVYRVVLIPRPNATVDSIVSNCRLFVLIPLSTCNLTLPSAGLVSDLRFVRTVLIGFGRITYMVAAAAEFKRMNSLSATGFFPKYPVAKSRRHCSRVPAVLSTLKASPPPLNEFAGDDVLREFLKERELSGDFIAKLSDELWLRGVVANSESLGEFEGIADNQKFNAPRLLEEESEGGFLKLKRTNEWLLGEDNSAPMNKKMASKEMRNDGERRKMLNFLRYEALKRELLLLTVGIGTACSGYCLVALSVQAAVSYATGVIFSCLYFQLLCKHADNISREAVPEVFTKKKSKKIGIRSEDLEDFVERTLKGSSIALSSPRLVIPAAIYGLWELSQHFTHDIFDFQLVPAMVGLFAYKAAALVQVYRDNEDLQFIFPENTDGSKLQSSLPMAKSQSTVLVEPVYSSVIALLIIVMACVELCDAVTVVDVYRLVQYDLAGMPFGSRLAALNHHAGSSLFSSSAAATDLSRTVLILPVRELNLTFIREYIGQTKPLGGLLLLLPQVFNPQNVDSGGGSDHDSANKAIKEVLVELEKLLLHANIPYPVYFGFEDDHVNAVLADVKKNDATGQPATATTGGYKLVVAAPEPKKIASPAIANIQGWLPGLKADGDSNQLPTIAVVASYDTFGAAPALSVGSDSNGSGVVALLEIARLFSVLYSSAKTRGRYNLLFVLTSGGPYNYNGTHKWLRSLDQRLRETIDYAICLNSIGSINNDLWIHVSKPPDNVYIKQIFQGFSSVSEELGLKVGLKHKKINISNPRVAWEHEQFSKLRVTAATLSELPVAPDFLESTGGLSDSRYFVDEASISRSVKLVAESLARHIYGQEQKNIDIFADNSSLSVNPSYIRSWLEFLSTTPRVAPFLSKNDPLIMALKKELADHTFEVSVQQEVLDGMFTFYDSISGRLHIYQVASVTFDLLLLLVLGSYLITLFCFLVITTRGLDDLISLFRRPTSRKVKTA
ncbi:Nicalin-1 [Sesamum alatum]|uniref:Nicalin-1 n=1 Tax=Sesamum alatum TaxID=300844 RepID=A0AAE2CZX9_9LAMI|nr:Nicalin-1 [Sesamum alatum]